VTKTIGPRAFIDKFKTCAKGMVVVDTSFQAALNIGAVMCGLDDAVMVTPEFAAQLHLPLTADLNGRWHSGVDAYRWAFENPWPRCNHHVLHWYKLCNLDYIVAHRIFAFHTHHEPTGEEIELAEDIFGAAPPNIPVMGSFGPHDHKHPICLLEQRGCAFVSQFAKYYVVGQERNLSLRSGVRLTQKQWKEFRHHPTYDVPLDKSQIYLTFCSTDGDVFSYFLHGFVNHNVFRRQWRNHPDRGKVPIGWSMGMAHVDLDPLVCLDIYRSRTDNDSFVGWVARGPGYGYPAYYALRYPPHERRTILTDAFRQVIKYARLMDIKVITSLNDSHQQMAMLSEMDSRIMGFLPDYDDFLGTPSSKRMDSVGKAGVPVVHGCTAFLNWSRESNEVTLRALLDELMHEAHGPERPLFVHVNLVNWCTDPGLMMELRKQLDDSFVFVRPHEFVKLCKQAYQAGILSARKRPGAKRKKS